MQISINLFSCVNAVRSYLRSSLIPPQPLPTPHPPNSILISLDCPPTPLQPVYAGQLPLKMKLTGVTPLNKTGVPSASGC